MGLLFYVNEISHDELAKFIEEDEKFQIFFKDPNRIVKTEYYYLGLCFFIDKINNLFCHDYLFKKKEKDEKLMTTCENYFSQFDSSLENVKMDEKKDILLKKANVNFSLGIINLLRTTKYSESNVYFDKCLEIIESK